jgi:two-component system nitrate/nitrite response regulator NarL
MNRHNKKIKVFLVDDHPAVREGIRSYLNAQGSFTLSGEAADGSEALRKLKKTSADVIVLDISLPGVDGGELARRLRQAVPDAKLIAFSIHSSREYVVRMAHSGVHGYVTKDAPTDKLVEAIHRVHAGDLQFPPAMADAILDPGSEHSAEAAEALTDRERDVLTLLAEGLANKEIARKLGISVRTTEAHREHLTRKLHITPVAGLTKYAIQEGLTTLSLPSTS